MKCDEYNQLVISRPELHLPDWIRLKRFWPISYHKAKSRISAEQIIVARTAKILAMDDNQLAEMRQSKSINRRQERL